MKLRLWQPKPEDDEDVGLPPPFGVHPLLDLMAMQHFIITQQRDIWRAFITVWRRIALLAALWAMMALLWAGIAVIDGLRGFRLLP